MLKNPQGSVHVRLDQPLSKRREVLQTAIDVVELTKRIDHVQALRAEKMHVLVEFRKALRSLHASLREVQLKEMPIDEVGIKQVRGIYGRKVLAPERLVLAPKKVHRLESSAPVGSLDRQLQDLRRKLDSL